MSTRAFTWSITETESSVAVREFATDVRSDLNKPQKELHSKYLYDELGSALFEAITRLPEYGLTRADERLLAAHAPDLAQAVPAPAAIIELGSGTGEKTRHILEAYRSAQHRPKYIPIDVSSNALARCHRDLSQIADVTAIEGPYLSGLDQAIAQRSARKPVLVLFLGSTIGNFERRCALEFLKGVRRLLRPGDAFLLGADLVKDADRMLLAYDDPIGLTAAFNLNLLGRVNRELGGDFDLRSFEHEARWNAEQGRIEMHLRSLVRQTVTIALAHSTVHFFAGETIWTESSHKFQIDEISVLAEHAGFNARAHWVDSEWPFVESLWIAR